MAITAFVPKRPFGYWEKRFADMPRSRDAFLPVLYLNSPDAGERRGFIREPVHTILIDLARDQKDIFKDFRSNTRNEIARAAREDVRFTVASNHRRFFELYSAASRHKALPPTSEAYLRALGSNLCVTEGTGGADLVVAHVYVVDRSVARARLIRSISQFRDHDKSLQSTTGRLNRFLHYQDMMYFQAAGVRWYDLGGFHPREISVSQEMRNISEFKASFGGTVVQEANYLSLAQHLYRRARGLLR